MQEQQIFQCCKLLRMKSCSVVEHHLEAPGCPFSLFTPGSASLAWGHGWRDKDTHRYRQTQAHNTDRPGWPCGAGESQDSLREKKVRSWFWEAESLLPYLTDDSIFGCVPDLGLNCHNTLLQRGLGQISHGVSPGHICMSDADAEVNRWPISFFSGSNRTKLNWDRKWLFQEPNSVPASLHSIWLKLVTHFMTFISSKIHW